jgi:hypothetical protein
VTGAARVLGPIAVAAMLAACQEAVPKTPSFELDVKPIFDAACVRCHGAGGTLNADPYAGDTNPPNESYLDAYADRGDCGIAQAGVPATCKRGALYEAMNGNINLYLHFTNILRMPLAPSEPLARWELDVVENWLAETPPMP